MARKKAAAASETPAAAPAPKEEKRAGRQPVSKEDLKKAELVFEQIRALADTLPAGVESVISVGRSTQSNASGLYLLMVAHRVLNNVFDINKGKDEQTAMLVGLLSSGALQLMTQDGVFDLARYYGEDPNDPNHEKRAKVAHVERMLRDDSSGSAAA